MFWEQKLIGANHVPSTACFSSKLNVENAIENPEPAKGCGEYRTISYRRLANCGTNDEYILLRYLSKLSSITSNTELSRSHPATGRVFVPLPVTRIPQVKSCSFENVVVNSATLCYGFSGHAYFHTLVLSASITNPTTVSPECGSNPRLSRPTEMSTQCAYF